MFNWEDIPGVKPRLFPALAMYSFVPPFDLPLCLNVAVSLLENIFVILFRFHSIISLYRIIEF